MVTPVASHLPPPFPDPAAYARAYAFVRHVAGVYHGDPEDWQEIRFQAGLSAEEVYRLLPSAPDVEYAGYLTRTRIRYSVQGEAGGYLLHCQPCTLHAHPTGHPYSDLPSFADLYTFLRYTHRRHITVGRALIWLFDKSAATLPAVERLNAWEGPNQAAVLAEAGTEGYAELALRGIGFRLPASPIRYRRVWPARVQQQLGIRVTFIERRPH